MADKSAPTVLNYTTVIEPVKTAGECTQRLIYFGAQNISMQTEDKQLSGLAFSIDTAFGVRAYVLPINVRGVMAALNREADSGRIPYRYRDDAVQARRVAWRTLKMWLESQLAMIDAGLAEMERVMLPYMVVDEIGTTVWDKVASHQLAIEA